MGQWQLLRLNAQFNNRDGDVYGHNFHVFYHLKYSESTFDTFTEPPKLDWHEKCIMLDHSDNTWWDFDLNLYGVKPNSVTFYPWTRRYIEAYRHAAGLLNRTELPYGSSKLFTKANQPVTVQTLGQNKANAQAQADAVRSYLKKNGGILVIEIHDNPGCRLPAPPTQHQERLLIFDVGVVGGGIKQKAEQWWFVDGSQLPATWQRSFTLSHARTFASRGFRKVATMANLTTPLAPAMSAGEYL